MFGAVGGFIGQNLMMIIGVITGGAALSSVRYIREYERGVVTRFGKQHGFQTHHQTVMASKSTQRFRVPNPWSVSGGSGQYP